MADLTTSEAAAILGIKRARVIQLITGGKLPAARFGFQYVIKRSDLAKVKNRRPAGRPKNAPTAPGARVTQKPKRRR